jgi:hypothetical protein
VSGVRVPPPAPREARFGATTQDSLRVAIRRCIEDEEFRTIFAEDETIMEPLACDRLRAATRRGARARLGRLFYL